MTMLGTILLGFLVFFLVILICCAYLLYRNQKIYSYRVELLRKISERATEDITNNIDWHWRYDTFESVSYDEMIYKFWKPLDSFYKDKKFIQ